MMVGVLAVTPGGGVVLGRVPRPKLQKLTEQQGAAEA